MNEVYNQTADADTIINYELEFSADAEVLHERINRIREDPRLLSSIKSTWTRQSMVVLEAFSYLDMVLQARRVERSL